ncbi:MAG: CsgG/HfaB family protein [Wenzhouxiangellaceae bacterium]|nr:CsgG/HfaB family protein [Wenzhouxiangellaceae bacterium]
MKHWIATIAIALSGLVAADACLAQAGTEVRVRESSGRSMADAQADHYNGPKARIAVARFENKTASNMGAAGWYSPQIGDGMADMLTTALVNSGRYIVLERESLDTVLNEQDLGASGRIRQDTAAPIGEIEGAELLVVAAVTEFEGNAGGTSGRIGGGKVGRVFGALAGGSRKAHMAIDLRVVDARTSRILAATSVEGEAKDFNLGGALGGYTGSYSLGGALSSWKNTPREKALRAVIEGAVDYVISVTPPSMLRYDAAGRTVQTASSQAAPAAASGGSGSGGGGDQVVVTVASLDAHQGPNASSPVVFTLGSGAVGDAVIRAGDWIQVRGDGGTTGWVAAEHTLDIE